MSKTKVHMVTVLIVDTDELGEDEVREVLENTRYPNHCMYPRVTGMRTQEVDWTDDHPLNQGGAVFAQAIAGLFPAQ